MYVNLLNLYKHFSKKRKWQLIALLGFMLCGALMEMATLGAVVPFLAILADPSISEKYLKLRSFFETLGGSKESDFVIYTSVLFIVVIVMSALSRIFLTWASSRYTHALGVDFGSEVYRRTLNQPYSYHVEHNTSEIIAGINKVNTVVNSIVSPLMQGMVSLLTSAGILIVLFWVDSFSAIVAITGIVVMYFLASVLSRRTLNSNSIAITENYTNRVKAIQEGLGGIRDVILEDAHPIYVKRFREYEHALRRAQAFNTVISATPRFAVEAFGMVLIISLAYWLTQRSGGVTSVLPVLGALALGAQKLLPRIQSMYYGWALMNGNDAVLVDVLNLLEQPMPEESRQGVNEEGLSFKNSISLENVSFYYNAGTEPVIRSLSFNIQRGEHVGFVGETGSGKSTLIDLIIGLLEPTSGCIKIDGKILNHKNRKAWQKRIAHVPQNIYLADTTIAENIAFGLSREQIDSKRMLLAAQKAQLSNFIDSLPDGYETVVGERGVRLSGGQCQRIGIARALYKEVDVLVLDEATSALDDETEASVMQAIKSLSEDLTVLAIAHRRTSLKDFDQLIELKDTRI